MQLIYQSSMKRQETNLSTGTDLLRCLLKLLDLLGVHFTLSSASFEVPKFRLLNIGQYYNEIKKEDRAFIDKHTENHMSRPLGAIFGVTSSFVFDFLRSSLGPYDKQENRGETTDVRTNRADEQHRPRVSITPSLILFILLDLFNFFLLIP